MALKKIVNTRFGIKIEDAYIKVTEIHRLNKMVEEILYPAMESGVLDIIIGKGPSARTIQLDLPPFTLIAATTRIALLSSPLRSRFSGGKIGRAHV